MNKKAKIQRFIFLLLFFNLLSQNQILAHEVDLEGKIKNFILMNPEIILESLQNYQNNILESRNEEEKKLILKSLQELHHDGYSYVGGNQNGRVVLVEFIDYQCGYCKKAHKNIEAILKSNADLRYVVKELPILGSGSDMSAAIALTILEYEGKQLYQKFNDALLNYNGPISQESMTRILENLSINSATIFSKYDSKVIKDRIERNKQLAKELNINGTPTFIIGSEIVRGYVPKNELQKIIDRAIAK